MTADWYECAMMDHPKTTKSMRVASECRVAGVSLERKEENSAQREIFCTQCHRVRLGSRHGDALKRVGYNLF